MPSAERARLGLAIVCLGMLVGPLDTTVNTAFPVITRAFSLPLRDIQWVVIPFVVAQSAFALVFGHLGDRLGHRRIFAFGLVASALTHAAVALAPDYPTMVAMRAAQGAAVGITLSCAPALVTLMFVPEAKGRVLAAYAAASSLGMAVGPWLGGLLLDVFDWPSVYWFRVPLALAALALLPLAPHTPLPRAPGARPASAQGDSRFDWPGAIGLPAVMACLALALAELTRPDAGAATGLALLAAGAAGTVWFVRHESRATHPVLRIAPFRSLPFSALQAGSVAVSLAGFANLLLLPYVFTQEAGVSIATAGLLLSAYPGGSVVGSLVLGRLAHRWSARSAMIVGLGGSAAGLLLTAVLLAGPPVPMLLALGMFACGFGQGLFTVAYMDATTSMLPVEERGIAGSLVNVTRLLGVVLGATLIGWLRETTGNSGISFAIVGGALAAFTLVFASLQRRSSEL